VPDDREPAAHLVDFVRSLEPVERALDVGCGDGLLTAELRADELVAADVSAVALERARRRLPDATFVHLTPDAPLPLEDNAFDLVVCTETIEHVRDTQLFLSELRRVLRPRGELAMTTPAHGRLTGLAILAGGFERHFDPFSPHLRFYTRRSLARALRALGFDVASMRRRRGTLLVRGRR
jgi:ubiquinone/menaquinone biosynthesis C-methylase UbiE